MLFLALKNYQIKSSLLFRFWRRLDHRLYIKRVRWREFWCCPLKLRPAAVTCKSNRWHNISVSGVWLQSSFKSYILSSIAQMKIIYRWTVDWGGLTFSELKCTEQFALTTALPKKAFHPVKDVKLVFTPRAILLNESASLNRQF